MPLRNSTDHPSSATANDNSDMGELLVFLQEVFCGNPSTKIDDKLQALNNLGIFNTKDLKYLKVDKLDAETFDQFEVAKLTDCIRSPEARTKGQVMAEIFSGTPPRRLQEIDAILSEKSVFAGKDFLLVNTNRLRKERRLQNVEISKMEHYIKQNNKDHYGWLVDQRETEEKIKNANIQLKINKDDRKTMIIQQIRKTYNAILKHLEIKSKKSLEQMYGIRVTEDDCHCIGDPDLGMLVDCFQQLRQIYQKEFGSF